MAEEKRKNIFGSFPVYFFNVLTGVNREMMGAALSALYEKTSYGTSFSLTYEDACVVIEDILENASYVADFEEEKLNDDHDKALFVLRRLKDCGWIEDDIGENYQRFIRFEDYAIEVMQSARRFSSDETEEYSGFIYAIYQLLKSIDPVNGDLAIERAAANTEDLFRQLSSLNTNIKKYIQNVMNEKNKDDLEKLMTMLLEDYQTRIVDRAYYNLTTKDNPEKFKEYILERIKTVREDDALMETMSRKRSQRKNSSYEEAFEKICEQLEYIEFCFESIGSLMDEIDFKNHKYVTTTVAKITFLLEAHEDLESKINHILKALMNQTLDPAILFQLYKSAYLDDESLYTMKNKRLKVKQSFAEEIEIDENVINDFMEILARERRFSRTGVEKHMLELLKDRKQIDADEMDLGNSEALTYTILMYLYGHDKDCQLEIIDKEETVRVNGYRFRNFTIRRRENG